MIPVAEATSTGRAIGPRYFPGAGALAGGTIAWGLVAIVAVLVVYPPLHLAWRLLDETTLAGIDAVTGPLSAALTKVLFNSAVIVVGGTAIALFVGACLAWINERTDAQLGLLGEVMPLAPLFVPQIAGVIGLAVLLEPRVGLVNIGIRAVLSWLGFEPPPFGPVNLYSLGGMVVVTGLYIVPFVYLVVSAALRNLDPSIEEASRVFRASPLRTLFRVTLPAIRPALVASAILGVVTGIGMFSVPVVLGAPGRIDVVSVFIYRLLVNYPPQIAVALILAGGMILVVQSLLILQRYVAPAGQNAEISGRGFRASRVELGGWRYFAKGLAGVYIAVTTVLPILGLLLVSLQPFWTPKIDWASLSLQNFREVVFTNPLTSNALLNSLGLAVAAASLCMTAVGFLVLYFRQRAGFLLRITDGLFSLPATIPHTVVGVSFLLAFAGDPFRLHGTLTLLLLAYMVMVVPFAARAAVSAASSIGPELPEASRVCGANEFKTFARILAPLALPGMLAGWIMLFKYTVGEVTATAFLAGPANPAIGRVLMELWAFGSFPQVAALALTMTLINGGFVSVLLMLSRRFHAIRIA